MAQVRAVADDTDLLTVVAVRGSPEGAVPDEEFLADEELETVGVVGDGLTVTLDAEATVVDVTEELRETD